MNIGIDARLINETGVGRYIRNLIREIGRQDKTNAYTVFLKKKEYESFSCPNTRWNKVLADIPWHSLSEQLIMPWMFLQARLDLVHIPYFNIPIFYPGRIVVTIHDLTILHFDTGRATTLPWVLYKLRRLGYRIALAIGLLRANKIIAVSNTTKQEIIDHFHISPEKIVVTYEGVDNKFQIPNSKFQINKRIIKEPYFLYVGNAYPHKNLETLLAAFSRIRNDESRIRNLRLVLVGKEDYFYSKLKKRIHEQNLTDSVVFFGQADDGELANLYAHAIAFVFPSLMEGFGLPAIEALSMGCPVIVSDIPVFRELLGDHAVYFNPHSSQDLCESLAQVCIGVKNIQENDTHPLLASYSWSTLASETLDIYRKATS